LGFSFDVFQLVVANLKLPNQSKRQCPRPNKIKRNYGPVLMLHVWLRLLEARHLGLLCNKQDKAKAYRSEPKHVLSGGAEKTHHELVERGQLFFGTSSASRLGCKKEKIRVAIEPNIGRDRRAEVLTLLYGLFSGGFRGGTWRHRWLRLWGYWQTC